jgi:hypothetical protein
MEMNITEDALITMMKAELTIDAICAYEGDRDSKTMEWVAVSEQVKAEIVAEEKAKKIAEARKQIEVLASVIADLENN